MLLAALPSAHARPLSLTELSDELTRPVHLARVPDEPTCLLISEHAGLVKRFCRGDDALHDIIDLRDVINSKAARGLLGVVVVQPQHNNPKSVFLSYIDTQGDLLVVRFPYSSTSTLYDSDMSVVIKIARIAPNGHGGALGVMRDGTLLVSSGDGEAEVKNSSHAAQSKTSLLGKVLRLNVGAPTGYKPAPGNPFPGLLAEVWALGFRNPDQLLVDSAQERVFVADNGELFLELNLIQAGKNYGWDSIEDRTCGVGDCKSPEYTAPALALPRKGPTASLIIGAIYRGKALPELRDAFVFAERSSGTLYSTKPNQAPPWVYSQIAQIPGKTITAVTEGGDSELYLTTSDGLLFRLSDGTQPPLSLKH